MTTLQSGDTAVYDAWNRIMQVASAYGTLVNTTNTMARTAGFRSPATSAARRPRRAGLLLTRRSR